MPKKTILLVLILAGAVAIIAPCLAQEDMQAVDNTAFARPRCAPALFDHDKHNEVAGIDDCAVCHHVYENGRPSGTDTSEDQSCSECHPPAGGGRDTISLRRAFHLRCKGCHLARDAGPVMCAECHPKMEQNNEKENIGH